MRFSLLAVLVFSAVGINHDAMAVESIDGRVVQFQMPAEDFTL